MHGANDVRQTARHTTDPLVPESSAFEFEMADEELKINKSEQHLLQQEVERFALRSFHLLILFGIRRNCLRSGRSRSLYLYMRMTKQTVIVTEAGRSHNINTENISFEMVEQFTCLGAILTYQNSIFPNTRSRLKLLSFDAESSVLYFLPKNIKINLQNYSFSCCFVWV